MRLACWLVRLMPLGVVVAGASVSCGGSTERDGDGAGGTAFGKAGTTASGGFGAVSAGGAVGTGGSMSVGGSGTTGGSGPLPDLCKLPPESGSCNAYFPSYYFDAATGACESFVYGGCGGNDNRFDSVEACHAACGGSSALDSCNVDTDCVLVESQCCSCPSPVLTNYVALNQDGVEAYRSARGCDGVLCEPCLAPDPTDVQDQYFVATCDAGKCVALDLHQTKATACNVSTDCFLRNGTGCCEGCSGGDLVSISDTGALMDLVCGEGPVPCPACAPMLPEGYVPGCVNGVCTVELSDMP